MNEKKRKLLKTGKYKKRRLNKPDALTKKDLKLAAEVATEYGLTAKKSDANIVNKIRQFLNKHKRLLRRHCGRNK